MRSVARQAIASMVSAILASGRRTRHRPLDSDRPTRPTYRTRPGRGAIERPAEARVSTVQVTIF